MWMFIGVYDPTMKRDRETFWGELRAIQGIWNDPWYIGGDFSMTRFPSECNKEGRISMAMKRFSKITDD